MNTNIESFNGGMINPVELEQDIPDGMDWCDGCESAQYDVEEFHNNGYQGLPSKIVKLCPYCQMNWDYLEKVEQTKE